MVDSEFRIPIASNSDIDDARKKLAEIKKIKREEADLRRRGGIFKGDVEEGDARRGLPRQKQSAKVKPSAREDRRSENPIAKDKRLRKEDDDKTKEFRKFQEQLDNLQVTQKKQEKDFSNFQEFLNPLGAAGGRISSVVSKLIPLALITEIGNIVIERMRKEFGPGGRSDLRKLILVATREVFSIALRIKRNRGDVFFASQNKSAAYQGAPGISNTERLADGHLRDILIDPGR